MPGRGSVGVGGCAGWGVGDGDGRVGEVLRVEDVVRSLVFGLLDPTALWDAVIVTGIVRVLGLLEEVSPKS
ncbi:hypothetical protein Tco_0366541 [Tanacetum coccineum]